MNQALFLQLEAKYQDLISRSMSMRRFGYKASADALLRNAFNCANRRDSMALADLMRTLREDPESLGGTNA
jgi:hypothetical protein